MSSNLRKACIAVLVATSLATSAQAGGMAEPIVEAETIVEDTAASAVSPILIGLLALVIIAAAVGGGSGGDAFR